ncbi:hypothetical protein LAZ67_16001693 [Cordylochernes scorpioides]|uniref:Uncharacterized protein n=1 Tax=Cordylochernes scorpioides TaxID=51811 RepID=A0ABY6LE42_9ARAC|nr:hypothetical protein LAZ67_16001693 [Cordylochernes scorpioides]
MDVLRTDHSAVNGVEWYAHTLDDALQNECAMLREIVSHVGRNETTVMRICDLCMQESTTHRRSHPSQYTTSRADRQIVRMAVTDRLVTLRTVAQHIQSVRIIQCLRVPFDAVYSRVVCPQDVHCFVYP